LWNRIDYNAEKYRGEPVSPRNPNEQDRVINNLIRTGTITQHKSKEGKLLARVDVHGRVTDWLPVAGISNRFMKIYIPVRAGEQVEVHSEFGEADSGVIHRSIYSSDSSEPEGADDDTAIIAFHDGATFKYNTETGLLTMEAISEAKIMAPHIELACETLHSTADVDIDGSLNVGGDISTDGTVTDARGDLSNFTTTDGAGRA